MGAQSKIITKATLSRMKKRNDFKTETFECGTNGGGFTDTHSINLARNKRKVQQYPKYSRFIMKSFTILILQTCLSYKNIWSMRYMKKSTSTDICDKTNFKRMRLSRYFSPIYERIAIFIEKWYRKIPHSSFNFLHSPHWKTTIPKYR